MKNVSRSKLLLCFRPLIDMEDVLHSKLESDCSVNSSLTYVDVKNKMETTKASTTKSLLNSGDPSDSENLMITRPPKRKFSRAVKAIVFGTILMKRVREKKDYEQESNRSNSKRGSLKNPERFSNMEDEISERKISTDGTEEKDCNLASSSSNSSNFSDSDITEEKHENHRGQEVKLRKAEMGCFGFNSGVCLLLISLIITVFWGRFLAILFTSIWFYFLRRLHSCRKNVTKLPETELRENRKRTKKGEIENHRNRERDINL